MGVSGKVSFNRRIRKGAEGVEYAFTKRLLQHTGHKPLSSASITDCINSLSKVTPQIEKAVEAMIRNGMHGVDAERPLSAGTPKGSSSNGTCSIIW